MARKQIALPALVVLLAGTACEDLAVKFAPKREPVRDPTITDHLILADKYLSEAHFGRPTRARAATRRNHPSSRGRL